MSREVREGADHLVLAAVRSTDHPPAVAYPGLQREQALSAEAWLNYEALIGKGKGR